MIKSSKLWKLILEVLGLEVFVNLDTLLDLSSKSDPGSMYEFLIIWLGLFGCIETIHILHCCIPTFAIFRSFIIT